VNEEFGLEDLQLRRLKVATLNELNDPFEFFAVSFADEELRRAFKVMKEEMAKNRGILCFSRSWHNPVQWSHYADKHRGMCFGFDIPDEHLGRVSYSSRRLVVNKDVLISPRQMDEAAATKLMFTKYTHWRYEDEVRSFVTLEDIDPVKKLYFAEFSDELRLSQVIVGANSTITRRRLHDVLGSLAAEVEQIKARIAFRSFKVVRQRDAALWL